jgi:ribosomal protein S1
MSKKRSHKPTSKAGEAYIKPFKESHKQKIISGLQVLRIGGTHEEIGLITGMRPDQVWKRLSEAQRDGTIYDTGITRKLKSGVKGIVWQCRELLPISPAKTDKQQSIAKRIQQVNNSLFG